MHLKKLSRPKTYRKITLSRQVEKSFRHLNICIVVLLAILYTLFLYIGTLTIAKGNILQKLQNDNNQLYTEGKILEMDITEAKTFASIENKEKSSNMEVAQGVTWFKRDNLALTGKKAPK